MKNGTKLIAFAIAVVMLLALSSAAFAAGNNSITVSGTKEGETLTIYKMFDLSVDDEANPTAFRYTVNSKWETFFTTGGAGAAYVNIDTTDGHVTWKENMDTEAAMIELGQLAAAAAFTIGGGVDKIANASGNTTFDSLEPGYYLITSTLGTKAIIDTTPTNPAPAIAEKNQGDTVDKRVREDDITDDATKYGNENDVQVGDTVEFMTEITLAPYTRNVKLHDTMTPGLAFNNDITITDLTLDTDYTVAAPGKDEGGNDTTFTITFTDAYLKSIEPDPDEVTPDTVKVTVTYSAKVTEEAITAGPGFATLENKTHLTYGNNQKTTEDKTTTKTYKFAINKYANSKQDLADAVFAVKRNDVVQTLVMIDATNYRIATPDEISAATNVKQFDGEKTIAELALTAGDVTEYLITTDSGDINVWGVDSDNNDHYKLTELKAPDGYNKLTQAVSVTVNTDNSTVVDVENHSGTELPSTGGIGTTIFYVIGGLLVVGAGVVLVSRRKSQDD